eukprot:5277164-Amphidinium_carterae.1
MFPMLHQALDALCAIGSASESGCHCDSHCPQNLNDSEHHPCTLYAACTPEREAQEHNLFLAAEIKQMGQRCH